MKNKSCSTPVKSKSLRQSFPLFVCAILSFATSLKAQITQEELMRMLERDEDYIGTATIGFLQGGGSLIGADFEVMASEKVGVQLGAGLVAYGAAINMHPKGGIRSSFFSLNYWHQGIGESYVQSLLGMTYVFRGKKWFTAQAGLGYKLEEGPGADYLETDELAPVQLLFSIGGYIPMR